MRNLLAAAAVLLCGVGSASAQVVSLEFHDGHVRLIAENVPVGRILAEWTRLGGTRIVNGERIPGAPVTLQLVDVPERQALDIVLRGAAGYMVAAREGASTGASVFDRILVLPTTSRAPSAATLQPPAAQPTPQFLDTPDDQEADGPETGQPGPPGAPPLNRLPPRARVQPGINPQNGPPQPLSQPEQDDRGPEAAPTRPTPGNPFGVTPGTVRPGVIIAPPPGRNDDPQRAR